MPKELLKQPSQSKSENLQQPLPFAQHAIIPFFKSTKDIADFLNLVYLQQGITGLVKIQGEFQKSYGNQKVQEAFTILGNNLKSEKNQINKAESELHLNTLEPEKGIHIQYNPGLSKISDYALSILENICKNSKSYTVTITSTTRTPQKQANIMYNNLEKLGVESQKKLYAAAGDKVIEVYEESKKANKPREETIQAMVDKIHEIGPKKVSKHLDDTGNLQIFDVAFSSIGGKKKLDAFEQALSDQN